MNVGVLYSPFDRLSNKEVEHDLKEMGTSVHAALKEAGYDPLLIDLDKTGFDGIQAMKLDLLFNVCERLHGDPAYEPQIASLLEMMGVNITGSSGSTLSVCNNKIMAKAMAQHHGILVPRSQVFSNRGQEYGQALEFPVIIKPASMHNSIGIFKDSLAYTEEDMRKKAGRIIYQYRQPALIEEYIPGRDIEVSILGNNGSAGVLPLVEVFQFLAEQPDLAAVDVVEEAYDVEEGGFAGARRAYDGDEFPARDVEVEPLQHQDLLVALGIGLAEAGDLEYLIHSGSRPRGSSSRPAAPGTARWPCTAGSCRRRSGRY